MRKLDLSPITLGFEDPLSKNMKKYFCASFVHSPLTPALNPPYSQKMENESREENIMYKPNKDWIIVLVIVLCFMVLFIHGSLN